MVAQENSPQNQGTKQISVLFDPGPAMLILKLTPGTSSSITSLYSNLCSHEIDCIRPTPCGIPEGWFLLSGDPHGLGRHLWKGRAWGPCCPVLDCSLTMCIM